MAWNEPGKGNSNDPWRGGEQGPPDFDKLLLLLKRKFDALFSNKPNNGAGQPPRGFNGFSGGIRVALAAVAVVYMAAGIYIVKPPERAAVFQFGRFVKEVGPGPHWLPPIIRSKKVVNVDEIHASRHRNRMLTKDENIVFVEMTVQYKVGNLEDYLFSVVDPVYSLEEAADSAIRQVVGVSTLDEILTAQRAKVRDAIREQLQQTLQLYRTGLTITDVAMQPARAPEEVKDAFDDAIKAQEDEQRMINQAQAYRERILPIALGHAQRILADARAYAAETSLRAAGDVARFDKLLVEYKKAPDVTRRRLYLDAMTEVLKQTPKVLVDTKNAGSMLYLPLDQWMKGQQTLPSSAPAAVTAPVSLLDSTKNLGQAASVAESARESRTR